MANKYLWGKNVRRIVCWISDTQKKVIKYEDLIIGENIIHIQRNKKDLIAKITNIKIDENPCIHLDLTSYDNKKGRIYCQLETAPMGSDSPTQYELVIDDGFEQFDLMKDYKNHPTNS